mmetsp:Transcript_19140/g.43572  ORF Transcript_19140/g.43572 Transcript_19140/m.43572 type:complete len:214 (+) Transcript_19140:697-1338(+)
MVKFVQELIKRAVAKKYADYYRQYFPSANNTANESGNNKNNTCIDITFDKNDSIQQFEPVEGNLEMSTAERDSDREEPPDLIQISDEDHDRRPPASLPSRKDPAYIYSCRKCRTAICTSDDLNSHNIGLHSFSHRKISGSSSNLCNNAYLEEPADWIDFSEGNEGRIYCPKCACKLGSYSWSGAQCSCGTWIVPAFGLQLGRMDKQDFVPKLQ